MRNAITSPTISPTAPPAISAGREPLDRALDDVEFVFEERLRERRKSNAERRRRRPAKE